VRAAGHGVCARWECGDRRVISHAGITGIAELGTGDRRPKAGHGMRRASGSQAARTIALGILEAFAFPAALRAGSPVALSAIPAISALINSLRPPPSSGLFLMIGRQRPGTRKSPRAWARTVGGSVQVVAGSRWLPPTT